MLLNSIKDEYHDGTSSLEQCLRQHTVFCLLTNFDQIRNTDKIAVECCECGERMLVAYDQVAMQMFCNNCSDVQIMPKHIEALQKRLLTIQKQLIDI